MLGVVNPQLRLIDHQREREGEMFSRLKHHIESETGTALNFNRFEFL